MVNDWNSTSRISVKRIELRLPSTLLAKIDLKSSEEGISRNEMMCRLLLKSMSSTNSDAPGQNSSSGIHEDLIKYIVESHYILSHQYGNSKGRKMDSLALEAAAEARKKVSTLAEKNGATL